MLVFALVSLLAAPPAGAGLAVTLRPAIVVQGEEPAAATEGLEAPEAPGAKTSVAPEAPHLAPAKAQPPKAKARKARSTASASRKGR